MAELSVGSIFAGHRIESVAGRGGMGVVYRATHLALDVAVALKVIAPQHAADEEFRGRFKRESRLAAAIDHPHVIPIRHAGEEDGVLYITMRYIDGTDLGALVRERGRLDPRLVAEIVSQVGSGLDAAHASGLIHRDVKPANVLVAGVDGAHHAYLSDFGLTKRVGSANGASFEGGATRSGLFVGTIDYAAPEQVMGAPIDARTDVYALGAVLYHGLTAEVPYPRPSDMAKVWAQMNDPPPSVRDVAPDLPARFDEVVGRAMAKQPDERYRSAGDLGRAAQAAVDGRSATGSGRSVATGIAAPTARNALTGSEPVAAPATVVSTSGSSAPSDPRATATSSSDGRAATGLPSGARLAGWIAALAALALGAWALVDYARPVPRAANGGGEPASVIKDDPARSGTSRGPNPAGRRMGKAIAVGSRPSGLAVDDDGIWVPAFGDDVVTNLGPSGRGDPTRIPVGRGPFAATLGAGGLWVTNSNDDTVTRIDPVSKSVVGPAIAVGDAPHYISAGYGSVWVSNEGDDTVSRIDPGTNTVLGSPIAVGDAPRGIATMPSWVWVVSSNDDTVTRIDRGDGRVLGAPIPVGDEPDGIAITQGVLFIANKGDDSVTRIKASSGRTLGSPTKVGDAPSGIAAKDGLVFVTNSGDDTVSSLSPDSGRVIGRPIRVPDQPTAVRIGDDEAWVVSNDSGSLWRIEP